MDIIWPLIAADSPIPPSPEFSLWSAISGGVGGALPGTAFAIWMAWYMVSKVIPEKDRLYSDERREAEKRCDEKFNLMEKRHADHMEVETRNNREDLKHAWDANKDISNRIASVLERLADKIEIKMTIPK